MWCTENGRVRKSMKTKGNSFAEDLGLAGRSQSSQRDGRGEAGLREFGRGHKGDGQMSSPHSFMLTG